MSSGESEIFGFATRGLRGVEVDRARVVALARVVRGVFSFAVFGLVVFGFLATLGFLTSSAESLFSIFFFCGITSIGNGQSNLGRIPSYLQNNSSINFPREIRFSA